MIPFELAGGSIVGRDHRVVPKNNQDAYHISSNQLATVAVVCDGCGSSPHSEVGAKLAAPALSRDLIREVNFRGRNWNLDFVSHSLLFFLHEIACRMGDDYLDQSVPRSRVYREVVDDYFLFTVVGVLLYSDTATFFGLGDGIYIVNGAPCTVGPFIDNAPPYLGHGMVERSLDRRLTIYERLPLEGIESFLIGCDGAGRPGLLEVCEEDRKLPGMEKTVGSISQFWDDDTVFSNPVALSRRLKLIARDWPPRDPEHGLLADDTTIVVGRRKSA